MVFDKTRLTQSRPKVSRGVFQAHCLLKALWSGAGRLRDLLWTHRDAAFLWPQWGRIRAASSSVP